MLASQSRMRNVLTPGGRTASTATYATAPRVASTNAMGRETEPMPRASERRGKRRGGHAGLDF